LYNINAMSNKIIAIILLMLVCIGGILYFYNKNTSVAEPVFCTQDVKLCPGGSYVGRTGPKCEFSECPIIQVKGTGTISGMVTTSPTCPVERIPPEPQCAPKPYATSIVIKQAGKTSVLKTIQSNVDGRFNTELPVGSYELKAANSSVFPRCNSVTVQVKSDQNNVVDISCDTGIR